MGLWLGSQARRPRPQWTRTQPRSWRLPRRPGQQHRFSDRLGGSFEEEAKAQQADIILLRMCRTEDEGV